MQGALLANSCCHLPHLTTHPPTPTPPPLPQLAALGAAGTVASADGTQVSFAPASQGTASVAITALGPQNAGDPSQQWTGQVQKWWNSSWRAGWEARPLHSPYQLPD